MLRFIPLILLALFSSIVGVRLVLPNWQMAKNSPDVMRGQQMPLTVLPLLMKDGGRGVLMEEGGVDERLDFQQMSGRVKLVNFWGSWCAPCRLEHPQLMQLAQDGRFDIIGINYKDKTANALAFLNEFGNPFKFSAIDKDGRTAIDWGVYGVPETYLIDESGLILYRHIGPITQTSLEKTLLPKIAKAVK